jgi:hypothetical protein
VRCPECGAVASVQDYPLLGGWTGRLASMAAVLWLLFVLAFTAALLGPIVGTTAGFSIASADGFATRLRRMHVAWIKEKHPDEDTTRWWNFETFDEWWQQQDPAAVLNDMGGFVAQVNWGAAIAFTVPWLLALLLGGCLSVALLHRTRRSLLLIALGIAALAAAIIAVIWSQIASMEQVSSFEVAMQQLGFPVMSVAAAFVWTGLVIGLLIGRTAARLLVTALLPPHLCVSLAVLWTAQGLAPPTRRERDGA